MSTREKKRMNPTLNKVWLGALLLFPIVLWILPSDFFDNSEVIMCPSRLFFNIECLGCGISRAINHFHHFEFEEALYFNSLVVFFYPALVVIWFMWVRNAYQELKTETA